MAEIPKQTWSEKSKIPEKQPLSPELEKQYQKEKEEILMLSKAQRNSLSGEVISSYLSKHHNIDISKYSLEIQKKFVEEVKMLFSEFKDFDTNMITSLRNIREWMSFWMEKWKSNEYYRNMIIWNTIETRIISIKLAIDTITWERIKFWNKEYNKSDYEELKKQTSKLDQTNGLNIFSKLENSPILADYWKMAWVFKDQLLPIIDANQPAWFPKQKDIPNLLASIAYNWVAEKLTNVKLIKWKTLNLFELFKEYNEIYENFESKNEVFQTWNKQLKRTNSWEWFWFNEQYNRLWYDKIKEVYKKEDLDIEKMWTADLIILLRVLFWVVPIAWDVVWWYDDGKQALAWVNFDGSMQWMWENVFMYLISWLQLSIVWWTFAKLAKWPKLTKAMMTIWKIIEKLSKNPEMLKDLAKNEKVMKMLEAMSWIIPKVGELLEKIQNWLKNPKQTVQNTFPNTTRVFTWTNAPKNIPRKRPEEVINELNKSNLILESLLKSKKRIQVVYEDLNLPVWLDRVEKNILALLKNNVKQDLNNKIIQLLIKALHNRSDLDLSILLANQRILNYPDFELPPKK